MSERRPARVSQLLQGALARLLLHDVRDPRVAGVTVTDVRVTPDLKVARVYVRHLAVQPDEAGVMAGLGKVAGFLRRRLGDELGLRWVPELRFEYDHLVDEAAKIEALLRTPEPNDGGSDT